MRESLYIKDTDYAHWLTQMKDALPAVKETFLLSTCNRTEVFIVSDEKVSNQAVYQWFSTCANNPVDDLSSCFSARENHDSVRHLVSVSAGLDSLVKGEPQIFGQVKTAYAKMHEMQVIGSVLDNVFQQVFRIAKRIRRETEVGVNSVSVASVAVTLVENLYGNTAALNCLLVGAGEMIRLVSQHLHAQGINHIQIANRSIENAEALAQQVGGEAISIQALEEAMEVSDLVISCTSAPLPLISTDMVKRVQKKRRSRPLLLIDLAVPRDIEAEVNELSDVYLYSVDDLQSIVQQNEASREQAAGKAEALIDQEMKAVARKILAKPKTQDVVDYRVLANQWRAELLEKALKDLNNANKTPEQVLEQLSLQLTQKLLHHPTQCLRAAVENNDHEQLAWAKSFLGLDIKD